MKINEFTERCRSAIKVIEQNENISFAEVHRVLHERTAMPDQLVTEIEISGAIDTKWRSSNDLGILQSCNRVLNNAYKNAILPVCNEI